MLEALAAQSAAAARTPAAAASSAGGLHGGDEPLPDVPIEHLDYSYIEKCKNCEELKDILTLLKSGKEGRWFELETFCEKRMLEVMPAKERKLYLAQHSEPSDQDKQRATSDLTSFLQDIGQRDASLRAKQKGLSQINNDTDSADPATSSSENIFDENDLLDVNVSEQKMESTNYKTDLPPVRGMSGADSKKSAPVITKRTPAEIAKDEKAREERISGYDFRAWDRYDVEAELQRIDEAERKDVERKSAEIAEKQAAIEERRKRAEQSRKQMGLPEGLDSMPLNQRLFFADREREKGNECFRANEFEEALRLYSRCVMLMPLQHNDPRPYANRAMAFLKLERWADAERDCDMALEVDSSFTKAYIRRGMARHRRGKYLDAIDDFEEALQHEPQNTKLNGLLAESRKMYNKVGGIGAERPGAPSRDSGKQETFKKLMIMEDSDSESEDEDEDCEDAPAEQKSDSQTHLADSSSQKKDSDDAVPSVGEQETGPSTLSENSPSSEPSTPDDYVMIDAASQEEDWIEAKRQGAELFKAADFKQALRWFSRATELLREVAIEGSSPDASMQDLCNCLGNMAVCQKELERWDDVVSVCSEVLLLQANNMKALFRRGVAYEEQGRLEDALTDMCQVLRLDPERAEAGDRISVLMGKINAATAAGLPTNKVKPASSASTPKISQDDVKGPAITVKQAEKTDVTTQQEKLAEQAPAPPAPIAKLADSGVSAQKSLESIKAEGNDMFKKGDLDAALSKYQQCLKLDDSNISVLSNLAMVYLQKKDYSAVEDSTSRALEKAQEGEKIIAKLYYRRALARKALENYEGACQDLEAILVLEPRNVRVQAELSQTQQAQRVASERKRLEERKAKQDEAEDLAKRAHARATAKAMAKGAPAFSVPGSSYEFQRVWRALSSDQKGAYLASIPSSKFAKIFRVELEDDTLMEMISIIESELIPHDMDVAESILKALPQIPRFRTTIKFLSKAQQEHVRNVVSKVQDSNIMHAYFS